MRLLILSVVILSGCTSQAVRCDAHLRPINAPATQAAQAAGEAGSEGISP